MPIRNDADELQSPEQLAAWLQVPVATIYAWNYRGGRTARNPGWSAREVQASRRGGSGWRPGRQEGSHSESAQREPGPPKGLWAR